MHFDQLLITIIILVISGLSTLIQRKRQQGPDSMPPVPPPGTPPRRRGELRPLQRPEPAPPPLDWEEQLRRLLEGEAQPVDRPVSPASGAPSHPAPAASMPGQPPPLTQAAPVMQPATPVRKAASEDLSSAMEALDKDKAATEEKLTRRLANLDEAVTAYSGAMQIPETTRALLQRTDEQTRRALPAPARPVSASLAGASSREQLRDRAGVRQAIILAAILGPPKALDRIEN